MSPKKEAQPQVLKLHGRELLGEAPNDFKERLINAAAYTSSGKLQLMLVLEQEERVPMESGIVNLFIDSGEEYKESFHRAEDKIYHLYTVGEGDRTTLRAIAGKLGIHGEEADNMDVEIAFKRGYPIRYKPDSK